MGARGISMSASQLQARYKDTVYAPSATLYSFINEMNPTLELSVIEENSSNSKRLSRGPLSPESDFLTYLNPQSLDELVRSNQTFVSTFFLLSFLVSGVSYLLFTHVTYQVYGSLFRVADAGIHRELYPVSDSEGILSNSLLQRSWFPSLWDTHQWTWLDCQLVSCVSLSIFNE